MKVINNIQNKKQNLICSSEYSGFKALGFENVQRFVGGKLKQFLNFRPIDISKSITKSDLVMIDYIFDFDHPETVKAYNHFMNEKLKLKQFETLNPINNTQDLRSIVFSDLTEIEKIYWQDKDKPIAERRIDRIFKGQSKTYQNKNKFKLNVRLVEFDTGKNSTTSKNILSDRNNKDKYYLFDTHTPYTNFRFLWDFYGDDISHQSSMLFECDSEFNAQKFMTFNVTDQMVIRSLSGNDFVKIQEKVNKLLPEEISSQIDWQKWQFQNGDIVNGYFTDEIFFKTELLSRVYHRSPDQMELDLKNYIRQYDIGQVLQSYSSNSIYDNKDCPMEYSIENCLDNEIQYVAYKLSNVLSPNLSADEKRLDFMKLINNKIFQKYGVGFLVSIIPPNYRDQIISYNMKFSAKGVKEIHFSYGHFDENDIYRNFLYQLGILNNRSYDLRLFVGDNQSYVPVIAKMSKD